MTTGGHFEWSSYLDLFAKSRRDLERTWTRPNLDDLFNLVCTVNHICDWIHNDSRATPGVKRDARNLSVNDPDVSAVRQLCNGAKHLRARTPSRRSRAKYWFERPLSSVAVSRHMPLHRHEVKYLVEIDGRECDLLEVVEAALTKWVTLLATHGMPTT